MGLFASKALLSAVELGLLPERAKHPISGGALSPRGDWRAPSDGTARVWLDELNANVP
jgi:hypothetical protein